MQVRDVMTAGCVTVPLSATLREAVEAMLEAQIGSVVVADDAAPVGIVTETDVLEATYESADRLEAVPVRVAMSHPVKHVKPTTTVRTAAARMREERVKRLLVAEGLTPRGMVTMTDLVWHVPDLLREAGELATGQQGQWNGRFDYR